VESNSSSARPDQRTDPAAASTSRQLTERPPNGTQRPSTTVSLLAIIGTVSYASCVVAIVVGSALLTGVGGLIVGGVLALLSIPLAAYSGDQLLLSARGREIARTVDEIRELKECGGPLLAQLFSRSAVVGVRSSCEPPRHHLTGSLDPTAAEEAIAHRECSIHQAEFAAPHDQSPADPSGRAAAVDFWGALDDMEQKDLLGRGRQVTYAAHEVLCRQGEAADHVIVIRSGWVQVCVGDPENQRPIAMRGPGDLIGERAAFHEHLRSATIVALQPVDALIVSTTDFAAFVSAHPQIVSLVENQIYGRLTEDHGAYAADEFVGAQRRLALVLAQVTTGTSAHRSGLLAISLRELASQAAVSVDTARSVVYFWQARKLVRVGRERITFLDIDILLQLCRESSKMPVHRVRPKSWAGHNCSVLLTDITAFGGKYRDDQDRRTIRSASYKMLTSALEHSKVPWSRCHREDRGDGVLVLVPPDIPTVSVLDPMLARLAADLRRHNHQASRAIGIQLRVAVHVGPVVSDDHGMSGESIILTARMLEAPAFKDEITKTGADLGIIASTFVYDTVIRHGPGYVNPSDFQLVKVGVKEARFSAWTHMYGGVTA
jgi:CRP-like cAMP-binding protein